jgi:dienelactone hydrolase
METGTLRATARGFLAWLLAGACGAGVAAGAPHDQTVPAAAAGAFPVACSSVAYDSARLAGLGGAVTDYWEGNPVAGRARYLTEILSDPSEAVTFGVTVPNDPTLYPQTAGTVIPYAAIVCYPTRTDNSAQDYSLPTGGVVPAMQRAGQTPAFAETATAYPLIVYSHGVGGSPLEGPHLAAITRHASHGYIVLAVFHGDGRFATTDIQEMLNLTYLFSSFPQLIEQQALRPLAVKAAIDAILARAEYAHAVDAGRIGGVGVSLGGETMLLALGGRLAASLSGATREVAAEPRIKAAVGIVPFTGVVAGGIISVPAFGAGQDSLAAVSRPFLAIAAGADTVAPLSMTEQAVSKLTGTAYLVVMDGVGHEGWYPAGADDVATWGLTFLDAYVKGDPRALETLISMRSVSGGVSDSLRAAREAPFFDGGLESTSGGAVLRVSLGLASTDVGRDGAIYVAALYNGRLFLNDGAGWLAWSAGSLPAYARGPLPASRAIALPLGVACSQLAGIQFYAGYGLTDQDMLANRTYGLVGDVVSCR